MRTDAPGVSLWAGWVFEPAGLALGFFGSCTGLVGDKRLIFYNFFGCSADNWFLLHRPHFNAFGALA